MQFLEPGFAPNLVPYDEGLALQRSVHADVVSGSRPDTTILLEHEAVYTAGKRTEEAERPTDGTPVVDVDRGGKITWHGPGQLVAYPIVALREVPIDVVAHVRRLEQIMIATCAEFGLPAMTVPGRTGVWLPATSAQPERKVGAIGVRVSRKVTMHGLALNCDCDLGWAAPIIPCGIADAGVTSLSAECGRDVTVAEVRPILAGHLAAVLDEYAHPRSALEATPGGSGLARGTT